MSQHRVFWEGSTDTSDYAMAFYKGKAGRLFSFGVKDNRPQSRQDLHSFAMQSIERSKLAMQNQLSMQLDNNIIVIENYNDLRHNMRFEVWGTNLACILNNVVFSDSPYIYSYYGDGFNVKADCMLKNSHISHLYCYRKLKKGIDKYKFMGIMQSQGYALTMKDVNTYTESILPYLKQKLNWE